MDSKRRESTIPSTRFPRSLRGRNGRREKEELSADELAQRIATTLNAQDGKIEILLPIIWLADENEFTIRWIDQFRN